MAQVITEVWFIDFMYKQLKVDRNTQLSNVIDDFNLEALGMEIDRLRNEISGDWLPKRQSGKWIVSRSRVLHWFNGPLLRLVACVSKLMI